jgi:excisionase family DNA binding protein
MADNARRELIDLREAAQRLGIRPRTLRTWVTARRIRHVRVGHLIKFEAPEVEAAIRRRVVVVPAREERPALEAPWNKLAPREG